MNKSTKKWLVLLMMAVFVIVAFSLAACDLFGPKDQPERLEVMTMSGNVPQDVTEEMIIEYIGVQYYDKTGNGRMLSPSEYTITSFSKTEWQVEITVSYNGLIGQCTFGFAAEEPIHVDFAAGDGSSNSQSVKLGECIREPETPTYRDFEFGGWYANESCMGEPWDFSTPLTSDIIDLSKPFVLFAKWKRTVTVNFRAADGSIHDTKSVDVLDQHAKLQSPEYPTKENYALKGWVYDENWELGLGDWSASQFNLDSKILDFYPQWIATFNVVFDTNGGEPIEPMTVKEDEMITLPTNVTKRDCQFLCWSYDQIGWSQDNIVYERRHFPKEHSWREGELSYDSCPAGSTITLRAEWYNKNETTTDLTFKDTGSDTCVVARYDGGNSVKEDFAVVIPSVYQGKTVVGIDSYAFDRYVNLTAVYMPDTVTEIGERAFYERGHLSVVDMPDSLETIGDRAFMRCPELNCVLPEGLLRIGDRAFTCTSFNGSIPSTVQHIGSYAFSNRDTSNAQVNIPLESVELPASLTYLGEYAFAECKNLKTVTWNASLGSSGIGAFYGCNSLTEVTIPGGTERIPDYMFYGCAFKSITLPSSLKHIGNGAFGSTKFKSLTLPEGLLSIGERAFHSASFVEVTIPAGVTVIPKEAFSNNSYLTKVIILSDLTEIGADAFMQCFRLSTVALSEGSAETGVVSLPSSLVTLGTDAFYHTVMESVVIGNVDELTIGARAFMWCNNLTSFSVSGTVKEIGIDAFKNSSRLKVFNYGGDINAWIQVKLNETFIADNGITLTLNGKEPSGNVTVELEPYMGLSVPDYAFNGLTKITGVTVVNFAGVGHKAFYGCTSLENITIDGIAANLTDVDRNAFDTCGKLQFNSYGGGLYLGNETNKYIIFIKPESQDITELTLNGSTRMVASNAFGDGTYGKLTTVTLNQDLYVIGENAFCGCGNVTELIIPSSVTRIGKGAFGGWQSLKRLTVPYVGERLNYADAADTSIKWIFGGKAANVPSTLTYLEITGGVVTKNALEGCVNLQEIDATETSRIFKGAFNGCNKLVKITLGDGNVYESTASETLAMYTVYALFIDGKTPETLEEVVIESGTIRSSAFSSATDIDKIVLGKNVSAINGSAFSGYKGDTLYFEGTTDDWNNMTRDDYWNRSSSITTVVCSNGTITL